jgi:hypothetical protein
MNSAWLTAAKIVLDARLAGAVPPEERDALLAVVREMRQRGLTEEPEPKPEPLPEQVVLPGDVKPTSA